MEHPDGKWTLKVWVLMMSLHALNPLLWGAVFLFPTVFIPGPGLLKELITFTALLLWFLMVTICMHEIEGYYNAYKKGVKWR